MSPCYHAHRQRLAHGGYICQDCGAALSYRARHHKHKMRSKDEVEAITEMEALTSWEDDAPPDRERSRHTISAEFWRTQSIRGNWSAG